jgi:membrane protease YdiL (CAAX protease family)
MELFTKIQAIAKFEPYWTLILVPIWQEIAFRYLPWRFWYLSGGNFWVVGITSSIAFAAIHWYFGKWFILWGFVGGMLAWFVMIKFGLLAAILLHALINVIDLTFGLRNLITNQ